MKRLLDWVQGFALALGGPGLFLIAFLDSSFLSFPEVVDLLIILLTIQHPHRMLYYALLSTLGSIAGCLVLFLLARKGGEAFLRKRLHERHIERATRGRQKLRAAGVLVPSLLPPPAPFKIFVLAAGVAQVRTRRLRRRGHDRTGHPLLRRGPAGAVVRRAGDDLPAREHRRDWPLARWALARRRAGLDPLQRLRGGCRSRVVARARPELTDFGGSHV